MDAVFFDMDGVLVDSEEQWKLVERPLFREWAPSWREEDHKKAVGLGVEDLYKLLAAEYGLKRPWETFRQRCQTIAEEVYLRRVSSNEEAVELICKLRKERIPVGLVSSSPHEWIRMVLDRFKWRRHFDVVVSADDVEGIGKPAPDIYLLAAKKMAAKPRQCVAIEDSGHGIASAKKAGITCIAFKNGSNEDQDLSGADFEIHRFGDLSVEKLLSLIRPSPPSPPPSGAPPRAGSGQAHGKRRKIK